MEEKNINQETLAQMQEKSKKMKKKLFLILGSVGFVTVALFSIIIAINGPENSPKNSQNSVHTYQDSEFYEPYEGNILDNKEYLGLDRKVYYSDGSGMETSIEEDNITSFDRSVLFLHYYIQTIIAGDHEAYNACFNDAYYAQNAPKGKFNPQMLYGAKITFSSRTNDNADILITYKLEYMIHRNDGTFRRDILSDASLPQYITLRIDSQSSILIEKISDKK